MRSMVNTIGVSGLILLNLIFVSIRLFARSQGLKVRWWSRSYAPERRHLRMLAGSADAALARRARRYLRLETLAWILFVPVVGMLLWGFVNQEHRPAHIAEGGPETWRVGHAEYQVSSTHYERGPGNDTRFVMTYAVPPKKAATTYTSESAAEQALPLIRYAYEHRASERERITSTRGSMSSPPNLVVDLISPTDGHLLFRYEVPSGEIRWRLEHPTER